MIFCPSTARTCLASKGSIMAVAAAMRRIQASDLMLMKASVLFDDNFWKLAATITPAPRQRAAGMACHLDVGRRARGVRCTHHCGRSAVRLFTHAGVQGQFAEQLHAVLSGHARSASGAKKELLVSTFRAHLQAHVLCDP